MNSTQLRDLFRADVVDAVAPYLWSDAEVYAYMNDAYYMFVRLTGGVADFTSAICEIDASANEATAEVSDKILRFVSATRRSDGREVLIKNYTDLQNNTKADYGVSVSGSLPTTIGSIRAMVVGMQRGVVRWIDIPQTKDTIDLMVYRLPLTTITGAGQSLVDVQEHHHIHLLRWMKSLAYRKQDAETFNKEKADELQAQFVAYCEQSKREWDVSKHRPRVVAYGGI